MLVKPRSVDLLASVGKARDVVEREVHLRGCAPGSGTTDVLDEVIGQLARLDELEEGAARSRPRRPCPA
jgi:hypothetical protein